MAASGRACPEQAVRKAESQHNDDVSQQSARIENEVQRATKAGVSKIMSWFGFLDGWLIRKRRDGDKEQDASKWDSIEEEDSAAPGRQDFGSSTECSREPSSERNSENNDDRMHLKSRHVTRVRGRSPTVRPVNNASWDFAEYDKDDDVRYYQI